MQDGRIRGGHITINKKQSKRVGPDHLRGPRVAPDSGTRIFWLPKRRRLAQAINSLFIFSLTFLFFFFFFLTSQRERRELLSLPQAITGSLLPPWSPPSAVAASGGCPAKKRTPFDGSDPPGHKSGVLFSQISVVSYESKLEGFGFRVFSLFFSFFCCLLCFGAEDPRSRGLFVVCCFCLLKGNGGVCFESSCPNLSRVFGVLEVFLGSREWPG